MEDELFPLLKAYGSLCPIRKLQWPIILPPTEIQEFLVEDLLLNPHFGSYPPDTAHQRSFWKWAIDNLESLREEIDERILEYYLQLLGQTKTEGLVAPSPSFRTYIWKRTGDLSPAMRRREASQSSRYSQSHEWITLLESGTTIENGTTGLRTWSASFALADYLVKHPDLLKARVLEIGSGVGFLGIIIAKLQMHARDDCPKSPSTRQANVSLTLSDVDHDVLRRCQDNLALSCNSLNDHPTLSCRILDWSDVLVASLKSRTEQFMEDVDPDVVIGADLVYDIDIVPALVATLALVLNRPANTGRTCRKAYIALTVRNEGTVDMFRTTAGEALFVEEEALNERSSLAMNESLEGNHGFPVRLFVLSSKFGEQRAL